MLALIAVCRSATHPVLFWLPPVQPAAAHAVGRSHRASPSFQTRSFHTSASRYCVWLYAIRAREPTFSGCGVRQAWLKVGGALARGPRRCQAGAARRTGSFAEHPRSPVSRVANLHGVRPLEPIKRAARPWSARRSAARELASRSPLKPLPGPPASLWRLRRLLEDAGPRSAAAAARADDRRRGAAACRRRRVGLRQKLLRRALQHPAHPDHHPADRHHHHGDRCDHHQDAVDDGCAGWWGAAPANPRPGSSPGGRMAHGSMGNRQRPSWQAWHSRFACTCAPVPRTAHLSPGLPAAQSRRAPRAGLCRSPGGSATRWGGSVGKACRLPDLLCCHGPSRTPPCASHRRKPAVSGRTRGPAPQHCLTPSPMPLPTPPRPAHRTQQHPQCKNKRRSNPTCSRKKFKHVYGSYEIYPGGPERLDDPVRCLLATAGAGGAAGCRRPLQTARCWQRVRPCGGTRAPGSLGRRRMARRCCMAACCMLCVLTPAPPRAAAPPPADGGGLEPAGGAGHQPAVSGADGAVRLHPDLLVRGHRCASCYRLRVPRLGAPARRPM